GSTGEVRLPVITHEMLPEARPSADVEVFRRSAAPPVDDVFTHTTYCVDKRRLVKAFEALRLKGV
ncbi:hypothetical protein EVAR_50619_1, partial [Eumeta japonica]